MKIKYLDGINFFAAFEKGAQLVSENKKHLNQINLFPVPDSDTGNNMSLTLNATVIKTQPENSFYNTLKSISGYAVESARGNSGLILAHFFSGLFNKMKDKNKLTTRDFAVSVKKVIPYLYQNIENPQEGTMITVIKDWGEHLHQLARNIDDFTLLFDQSLKTARKSLDQTKDKLEILKQADTVDAGAQGFVYFLEGMVNYWNNNRIDTKNYGENNNNQNSIPLIKEDFSPITRTQLTYRYCTEVLMTSGITSEEIKTLLKEKGDSLITARSDKITRIHLHTDSPAEIVHLLHKRGEIIEQKVDDMQRQQQMSPQNKKNIALVTDSIADIPQTLLDRYQIHLIPINIIIDGVNYLDKLSISPDYLYKYIETAEEFPSSAQPGLDFVYKKLREIAGFYDSILIIGVSEALSGTGTVFQKAKAKVEKEYGNINISYINSRLNSGAQGLLVLKAAEEIEKGKTLNQIEKTIKEYRQQSEILVKVKTLEYMVRGGRISPMKGFIANLLHLKPVVSLNHRGEGIIKAKALTEKSVQRKIKSILKTIDNISNIEKYAVVHARAREAAVKFKEEIKQILDFEPEYITEISSVTALNSGKGAVALSILAG